MSRLVSIVLPTYNRRRYLQEAIESVIAQTHPEWELFVIDDGSTDESAAWVAGLNDPRITLLTRPHTGHRAVLRNIGLRSARGAWIAFLDSDDRWKPDKLAHQLRFHAEHPRIRWSYSRCDVIDAEGRPSVDARRRPWRPFSGLIVEPLLTFDAQIALPSVMTDRDLLLESGGFDERHRWGEDQELWLRLAQRAECGAIERALIEVRAHQSTSYKSADVYVAYAEMYGRFARDTADPRLRTVARRRQAFFAVQACQRLSNRGEPGRQWSLLLTSVRARPLQASAYAAMLRWLWRSVRPRTAPTAPAA